MRLKNGLSMFLLIMLFTATLASAERYEEFLDFESSALGSNSGGFGRVSVTSAPQGPGNPTNDCRDLFAAADSRAVTANGSPTNCADRSGILIVDAVQSSRNGILILDFTSPGLPDTVSFEVHQGPPGAGSGQGVEPVEVRFFSDSGLEDVQSSQTGVALHELSTPRISRVEIECNDGFTVDNLYFSGPIPGTVTVFSSDDRDKRDSQIFSFDLDAGAVSTHGPVHHLADLETLILDPETGWLHGITAESGELWRIDKSTGALTAICTVPTVRKFREIASSSFHPSTGELWAYQWNKGLVRLDLEMCELTRQWNHPLVVGFARKWDGIAWKPDASALYASQRNLLIVWDPVVEAATVICSNLPNKTEGLEYAPDGRLLGSSNSKIYEIEPETCTVTEVHELLDREDIESLTFETTPEAPPAGHYRFDEGSVILLEISTKL